MLRALRRIVPAAALIGALTASAGPKVVDEAPPKAVAARPTVDILGTQVGASLLTTAVMVPASFAVAAWAGSLSGNILLSALPGLLIGTLLPPVAVSLAAWWSGNAVAPGRFQLLPALLVTAGVSVAATIVAGFAGLNANEPGRVALFTAVQSGLLPAAAIGTMYCPAMRAAPQVTVARIDF